MYDQSLFVWNEFAISIAPRLLWFVLLGMLVFYVVITWTLVYHWKRHAPSFLLEKNIKNRDLLQHIKKSYFVSTGILIGIMIISIVIYAVSYTTPSL